MNEKKLVGETAVDYVKEGMVLGLGTGSTVSYTIAKLGRLVQQGFSIKGVPSSVKTEKLALEAGIPLAPLDQIEQIDLAIDGADEVDLNFNLIKGGGGALLREKIIAKAAKSFIVVADSRKIVKKLGTFPLPVEVVPFGLRMTIKGIQDLGLSPEIRQIKGALYKTDNGNNIVDCKLPEKINLEHLEQNLNSIPGVVDNGLFIGMADTVMTVNNEKHIVVNVRK
ncbi:ribose 5-phosphate isomerase A [Cytobacillus firmus]|uniref:ribose 5-phosphate isomerase A n=1 Tax=Cytobacillus firmus TaxID=1399 RepID=UPI0022281825|nr:ribose 5-phosphate isomerase A [Cytobacillus firmus]